MLLRIPHQRGVFNELTLLSKVVKVLFPPNFLIMGALERKRVTTPFSSNKSPSVQEFAHNVLLCLSLLTWTMIQIIIFSKCIMCLWVFGYFLWWTRKNIRNKDRTLYPKQICYIQKCLVWSSGYLSDVPGQITQTRIDIPSKYEISQAKWVGQGKYS